MIRRTPRFRPGFGRVRPLLWLALTLASGLPLAAPADAYLDALKEEANAVQVDPLTREPVAGQAPSPAGAAPTADATEGKGMPAGLTQAEFEDFLQKKYFGSFSFYRKLPRQKKDAVFQAYSQRPDIRFIREQIKQTYLNQ